MNNNHIYKQVSSEDFSPQKNPIEICMKLGFLLDRPREKQGVVGFPGVNPTYNSLRDRKSYPKPSAQPRAG